MASESLRIAFGWADEGSDKVEKWRGSGVDVETGVEEVKMCAMAALTFLGKLKASGS
jgi:hypothetical protein